MYRGRFDSGRATHIELVTGISRQRRGDVNFDAEISADGNALTFVDGVFAGGSVPRSADLAPAVRGGDGTFHRVDDSLLARVNTNALEYAPATWGFEMFFTRLDDGTPAIHRSSAGNTPERAQAITGFVEAPALSPDGRSLYYHARRGRHFVIERVTRWP